MLQNCHQYHERCRKRMSTSMDSKTARAQIRKEWEVEARENAEEEQRIERRARKWRLATALLGLAFVGTCVALTPFLAGHSHHNQWNVFGKKILVLAMVIFNVLVLTTVRWLLEWNYLWNIKKIHVKYAPPNIKYKRTEKI